MGELVDVNPNKDDQSATDYGGWLLEDRSDRPDGVEYEITDSDTTSENLYDEYDDEDEFIDDEYLDEVDGEPTPEEEKRLEEERRKAPISEERRRRKEAEKQRRAEELRNQKLATFKQLQYALDNGVAVRGDAAGIDILTNPKTGEKEVFLTVMVTQWCKVRIPYGECYYRDPTNKAKHFKGDDLVKRKREILGGLVGADILLILTDLFEDKENNLYLGLGSRKKAMVQMAKKWFHPKRPEICPGDIVETSVLVVSKFSIVVSVYGIDVLVPRSQLGYRYIKLCTDVYHQRDKLRFSVHSVKYDEHGFPTIYLSARPIELAEAKEKYNVLSDTSQCLCTVSQIDKKKSSSSVITFYGWISFHNLPVVIRDFNMRNLGYTIEPGDVLRIAITKHYDAGLLAGNVIKHLGKQH